MKSIICKIAQLAEVAQLAKNLDHWDTFNVFYYSYLEQLRNRIDPDYLVHTLSCAEIYFNRKYHHGPMYNNQIFSVVVEDLYN